MKATLLVIMLALFLPKSYADGRSERRKAERIEETEKGLIGSWKLRDAHYNPIKPKMNMGGYRYITKQYLLEHYEFRADHTFTWVSTKDSATHTGTWAVTPFDDIDVGRKWGFGSSPSDERLRWSTDLTLTYPEGQGTKTVVFDALFIFRRFNTPVKFTYTIAVPTHGRDYMNFFFVRDNDDGSDSSE